MNDSTGHAELSRNSRATVFSQRPDTNHLLGVGLDAQERGVTGDLGRRDLSLDHVPRDRGSRHSFVTLSGAEPYPAAPDLPKWLPQQWPKFYDYSEVDINGKSIPSKSSSTGWIRSLPLLLALAAFSAFPHALAAAFNRVQPVCRRPHNPHYRYTTSSTPHALITVPRCQRAGYGGNNILRPFLP